jgi:hypothetical protein
VGVLEIARAHLRRRASLAKRAAAEVRKLWGSVDRQNIAASWQQSLPAVMTVMESAQAIAAASAGAYLDDVLEASRLPAGAEGRVRLDGFVGVASDGRDLTSLMYQPVVTALTAIQKGATQSRAMAAGAFTADLLVHTQVADAGRVADEVALCARSQLAGYVRVLSLPSCSRCVILGGKFFEWNAGFFRHENCDCVHVAAESPEAAEPLLTEPKTYFDSLSVEEQDRIFTKAGAEAIRLGSDIAQVVNARKGARGLSAPGRVTAAEVKILRGGRQRGHLEKTNVFGQQLNITNQGATVRGLAGRRLGARESGIRLPGSRYRSAKAPRLMPEAIFQIAGQDRDEAVRLLKRNGYLI